MEENSLHMETFKAAWEIIDEHYYDRNFQGLDWDQVYHAHQPAVEAADDMETVRMIIREMLGKLGQSHFSLIPRSAGISPGPGSGVDKQRSVRATDTGIKLIEQENDFLVFRVRADSVADEAGIRPGFEILEVDGRRLAEIAEIFSLISVPERLRKFFLLQEVEKRLRGFPGEEKTVLYRDETGEEQSVSLTLKPSSLQWSRNFANMPAQPLELELRKLNGGIHYIRFNFFTFDLMKRLLDAIREAEETDARGIIFDLRGNTGGIGSMATVLIGHLTREKLNLGTMHLRNGHVNYLAFPQPDGFYGKVAVLVDKNTASTGEIFASGLQEAGRARIFGEQTAGAVLPSMFRELPNGDLLQYVVGDFRTDDDKPLESRGVIPDERISVTRKALLENRDPALRAAGQWILKDI